MNIYIKILGKDRKIFLAQNWLQRFAWKKSGGFCDPIPRGHFFCLSKLLSPPEKKNPKFFSTFLRFFLFSKIKKKYFPTEIWQSNDDIRRVSNISIISDVEFKGFPAQFDMGTDIKWKNEFFWGGFSNFGSSAQSMGKSNKPRALHPPGFSSSIKKVSIVFFVGGRKWVFWRNFFFKIFFFQEFSIFFGDPPVLGPRAFNKL